MSSKTLIKFIWSFFVMASFGVYVYWNRTQDQMASVSIVTTPDSTQSIQDAIRGIGEVENNYVPPVTTDKNPVVVNPEPKPRTTPVPKPTPRPVPAPTPAPTQLGMYKDGSYAGSLSYAYTGNLRVKAIISGGKLTDVQVTDYSGSGTSQYINSFAVPLLKSEAIQAQSANVDIVSGATATSGAFQESLGAALATAKN